ncbi:anhydro-N-acetylmuramic acid kinase [Draconibacterium sp. IB214405]|uniref:anhydro-N-acetylmuramic acid kinase n=1 Tax=Draconibacterium sp. IB214405 TaxID=3097352 RepID=UPI002A0B7DA3|nr:anhydro-N-acetylmuramic acid kinase [Draconibacterium sp. IB214405]MDX8339849.1 anhydro-N-acetylmuramic acid kinase [Draconibacterium sp. IB214405]
MESKNTIKAIGMMSGTSLDGLDIAAVEFSEHNNKWSYNLHEAVTIPYNNEWKKRLETAHLLSGIELTALNTEYGIYLGEQAAAFIEKTKFATDIIASHGHTVFHQPENGFTLQTGSGAHLAARTKCTTICDFRTGDVALGGQGAPLVPIGDRLLFSEFDYCLNLGGFANISFEKNNTRLAFDNCPVNIVLNPLAEKFDKSYDKNGELGRQGKVNAPLLEKLNALSYYQKQPPKSLGREWIESEFLPILNEFDIDTTDKMRTVYEHIAIQITKDLSGKGKMLVTGGGAFNSFLIERMQALTSTKIVLPDAELIDFKEAIVFAFMGVLRLKEQNNCLSSVTGARKDSCGGVIFLP